MAATEEVVTIFRAEIEGFRAKIRQLESEMAKFANQSEQAGRKFTDTVGKSSGAFQKIKQDVLSIGAGLGVAFGAAQLVQFSREAVQLSLKLEGIRNAFERLNKPGLLDELRKATRGTVSDLELMRNAVQANNFQIPLETLGTLFQFASQRARETGESVEFLVQSIVTGIARKSPLILDNLGINIKRIQEEFAKTGDFAKAATTIVNEELKKQGDFAGGAADNVSRLAVRYEELKTQVGDILVASLLSLGAAFDLLTGNIFDLVQTSDELEDSTKRVDFEALQLANSFSELDLATQDYVRSNSTLNESLNDTLHRLQGARIEFQALTKVIGSPEFRLAILQNQKDLTGAQILELEKLKVEVQKNADAQVEINKQKSIKNLDNLKQELSNLQNELEKQEIGSEGFKKTQERILAIQKEIDAALGKSIKDESEQRNKAMDEYAANLRELSQIRISLMEDERERSIAEVEFELKERLARIKGNSQVENDLRLTLQEKALRDIEDINKEFDQRALQAKINSLEILNKLTILDAENNGRDILDIQKQFLRDKLDLELQNQELSDEQRKLLIAQTEKEIGDLSIKRLHEEADEYQKMIDKEIEQEQRLAEEKERLREQTIQAVFDLQQIAFDLSQTFTQANFENEQNHQELLKESELESLQELVESKIITQEDYNARKEAIEKKYDVKARELAREAARREKLARAFSIAAQTVENAVKALGVPPVPNFLLAGIVTAQGLAQELAVLAKPLPFAKGTKSVPGVDRGYDTVPAILRPKEMVFPVETSSMYKPALDAIFDHDVSPRLINAIAVAEKTKGEGFAQNVASAMMFNGTMAEGMDYRRMRNAVATGTGEIADVLYQIRDIQVQQSRSDFFKSIGIA